MSGIQAPHMPTATMEQCCGQFVEMTCIEVNIAIAVPKPRSLYYYQGALEYRDATE